eukprot:gene38487-46781_t
MFGELLERAARLRKCRDLLGTCVQGKLMLEGMPIPIVSRHEGCNRSLQDFPFDHQHLQCAVCFALDGRICLSGSHPPRQPAESKIGTIVKSLRKVGISRPLEDVLGRIARSDRLLDFGAVKTEYAVSVYEDVKNMAGTETKSYIGEVLGLIAREGKRMLDALEYIHTKQGYVHLDVKAMNIFVSHNAQWFLGDFGSCKPKGHAVTSSTFQFYFEDTSCKAADPYFDWFMFLVLLVIETLSDRRSYVYKFKRDPAARYVDFSLVTAYAKDLVSNPDIGELMSSVLARVLV